MRATIYVHPDVRTDDEILKRRVEDGLPGDEWELTVRHDRIVPKSKALLVIDGGLC